MKKDVPTSTIIFQVRDGVAASFPHNVVVRFLRSRLTSRSVKTR